MGITLLGCTICEAATFGGGNEGLTGLRRFFPPETVRATLHRSGAKAPFFMDAWVHGLKAVAFSVMSRARHRCAQGRKPRIVFAPYGTAEDAAEKVMDGGKGIPQRLKPGIFGEPNGTAEAVPLQSGEFFRKLWSRARIQSQEAFPGD